MHRPLGSYDTLSLDVAIQLTSERSQRMRAKTERRFRVLARKAGVSCHSQNFIRKKLQSVREQDV